jgi:rubrerythrin
MMKALYNKEELVRCLTKDLDDELEGIINYEHIYKSFIELGLTKEATIIERIAADEYDHAVSIWDMLKEHGADLTHHADIQEKWNEVKKIYSLNY